MYFSPEGHLFDKEALLQYMVTKKTEYCRKLKEYEKQKNKEKDELAELGKAEQQSKVNDFLKRENMVKKQNDIYKIKSEKNPEKNVTNISNMANGLDKQLPSFWVPSETPDAKKAPVPKPVNKYILLYIMPSQNFIKYCLFTNQKIIS